MGACFSEDDQTPASPSPTRPPEFTIEPRPVQLLSSRCAPEQNRSLPAAEPAKRPERWTGPPDAPRLGSWVPEHTQAHPPPADRVSWSQAAGSAIRVRCGPDYKRAKLKQRSGEALYRCLGMDMYRTERPVQHLAAGLQLPMVETTGSAAPAVLVVNIQLPTGSPALFGKKTELPTVNIVFTFVLSEWAAEALADPGPDTPGAIRLLERYFSQAPGGWEPNRFKLIGQVTNWEEAGLPGMLARFNAKPTLVTKSGTCFAGEREGVRYAELDCNTAQWCYMARQALHSSWASVSRARFEFAVLLEAREDEFMPEQVLGVVVCNHLQLDAEMPQWELPPEPTKPPDQCQSWPCQPGKSKGS